MGTQRRIHEPPVDVRNDSEYTSSDHEDTAPSKDIPRNNIIMQMGGNDPQGTVMPNVGVHTLDIDTVDKAGDEDISVELTEAPAAPAPEPPVAKLTHAFLPVLLVLPLWTYTMASNKLFEVVFSYYPMTIGMVAGSFVAGSTPLGGGVIGFPVAVLVLGFEGSQARDFSVLIQCVGMNSAAFLNCYLKPHMVHGVMVIYSVASGTIGCIIGLLFPLDSYALSLGFSVYLTVFSVVYFYRCEITTKAELDTSRQAPDVHPQWSHLLLGFSG